MSDVVDSLDTLTERMGQLQQHVREQGQSVRHARMRAQVLERWDDASSAASGPRWWAWSGALGAVAAAVLLLWVTVRPGPLTFQVERSADAGQAQAFVAADDERPLTLTFSDGSAVELQPGARARVGALRKDGADLVLESGALEVDIEPRASGSWSIAAGPYRVDVVGTAFMVRWSPEEEAFELALQRGRVQVRGPRIDGTREVAEGERLVILGRGDRSARVDEAVEPGEVPEEPLEAVVDEPAPEVDPPQSSRRTGRSKPPRSGSGSGSGPAADWRTLAHQGSYVEAIAAAEAAGFSRLCASLDAAALLELADAGRYARRSARAREALLALRRRFAGTEAAAAAAFDLGRLGTAKSACADASQWFRTYLRERPQGSMADAARRRIDECAEDSAEEGRAAP